jgi:hypothetical protein
MFKKRSEELHIAQLENEELKLGEEISHLHEILVSRKASSFDRKADFDSWRKETENRISALRRKRDSIKQKLEEYREQHFIDYWLSKLQPHLPLVSVGRGRVRLATESSNIARILTITKVNEKFETVNDIPLACEHTLSKGFSIIQYLVKMAREGNFNLKTHVEPLLRGLCGNDEFAFDFPFACNKRGHRITHIIKKGFSTKEYHPKTVYTSIVVHKPRS